MTDAPELTAEQRESLVAYLDGELTEAEKAKFEQELASSPALQEAKRQLEQTWEMLDAWEPADSSHRSTNAFTQVTVSLAAESLTPGKTDTTSPSTGKKRTARLGLLAAAAIAICLIAYNATASWLSHQDDVLLDQLPLIVQVDRYRSVDDLEYLRSVAAMFASTEAGEAPTNHFTLAEAPIDRRRDWVKSLDEESLFELRAKHGRYLQLDSATQQRMLDLHAAIQQAPNRQELQQGLLLYTKWLGSLSAVQRTSLLSMGREQRLAALETALEALTVEADPQSRALVIDTPLKPSDLQVLRRWSRDYIEANRDMLSRRLPPEARRTWETATATRQRFMLLNVLTRPFRPLGPVASTELEQLTKTLSPAAREALERDTTNQRELLAEWLQRATTTARPGWTPTPTLAALKAFYRTLTPGKRRYLDQLPPAQSREALIAMYVLDRRRRPRPQPAAP